MYSELIQSMLRADSYNHPCDNIELIETHISWVILTGDIAYKIKKPVNFGFLDFTSLASRKQYCEAELNLNSRSAKELYLNVVPISGTAQQPKIGETEEAPADKVIEYAIKMRQFRTEDVLSELHDANALTFDHIDELADRVASFHEKAESAAPDTPFGNPEHLILPAKQNFEQIRERLSDKHHLKQLAHLENWSMSSFDILSDVMRQRKANHMVRECHGDLHLKNITLFNDKVTLFDCIEFNESFRWVDVISDMAFLVMDLEERGLHDFANRFLNHYMEETGDYQGLKLLPFYKAYRAIVRAKISLFEMDSFRDQPEKIEALWNKYQSYIDLAESCSALPNRFVLTMHGVSGTGKSTVALRLVDRLGALRIRSDVERKRLYKLDPYEHPSSEFAQELYSQEATELTYEKLAQLASHILSAGMSVIVDATNLQRWQRERLEEVATDNGVPFCIADCQAAMNVIETWIHQREDEDDDASDANFDIVDRQMRSQDELSEEELRKTFIIHSDIIEDTNELVSEIRKHFL
jgi:aminoglycoside phosphotransferase family enzyme/predicted kinase